MSETSIAPPSARRSIGEVLHLLLLFPVLFPFVPSLIAATDTQPTFLLIFAASVVAAGTSHAVGRDFLRVSLPGVTALAVLGAALAVALFLANALQPDPTIIPRLITFVQFVAAALWAATARVEWSGTVLSRAVVIYAVFTVVYFLTGGLVEDILIRSRLEDAAFLFSTGRGARTLAPEPSFFALQIFNLFVLFRLLHADDELGPRRTAVYVALTMACLAASFSAYGALLVAVVLFVSYPRYFALAAVAAASVVGILYDRLEEWQSVRAIKVLLAFSQSGGSITELIAHDASFSSRIASFATYWHAFREHPLVGNGLSLNQGGGFISLVAAFGVLGVAFFAIVVAHIVFGRHRPSTKLLLCVWFFLNFVSGPIGVPILGVIVGRLLVGVPGVPLKRQSA